MEIESVDMEEFVIIPDYYYSFYMFYEKYRLKVLIRSLIYHKRFSNIYVKFVNNNVLNNLVNIKKCSIISKDFKEQYNNIIVIKNRNKMMNEIKEKINKNIIRIVDNNNVKKRNISDNISLIYISDCKLTYKKRKYENDGNHENDENDKNILLKNDSMNNENKSKEKDNITIKVDNLNEINDNNYDTGEEDENIHELIDNYMISCCTCCSYIGKIFSHYCNRFYGFLKKIFM